MNRAKREALLLGEPLPLPYKVTREPQIQSDFKIGPKKRSSTESNPVSDPFRKIVVGKIRERQISAEINRLSQEIETRSSLERSVTDDNTRQMATIARIVLLLRLVEAKLPTLDSILAQYTDEKLALIELQLDRLSLELGETPELIDIDKIRRKSDQIDHTPMTKPLSKIHQTITTDSNSTSIHSQWSNGTRLLHMNSFWMLITAVIIFFVSSYAVSGLTYDYCYYFC